jgi:hypothetical protein
VCGGISLGLVPGHETKSGWRRDVREGLCLFTIVPQLKERGKGGISAAIAG